MVPLARFAVAMPAVYFLVSLLLQRANADQLRSAGHQFRIDWHDAQHGITPPPYHAPSNALTPIGLLVGVITVAAVVFACIWQHRAASAGRALGIPSELLAGLGRRLVVRAGRQPVDALRAPCGTASRPGTPHRPRVLHWWIALLLRGLPQPRRRRHRPVLDGTRARRCPIPAALACLAVIAWAPGIVLAIAASHQEVVEPRRRARTGVLPRLTDPARLILSQASATRTYELFTSGLRSCCLAFTLPRYVPGSGRRRDHPGKSQSRYDRRRSPMSTRRCRPSTRTRPAPSA